MPIFLGYYLKTDQKTNSPLDKSTTRGYNTKAVDGSAIAHGGIAQLGERLNGIQEVSGSIPLISTNKNPWKPSVSKDFFALGGTF